MNPFKLFVPNYVFDLKPGFDYLFFWPVLIFFILVFAISFYVKKAFHKKLKHGHLLNHIPGRMREFALLGILLNFFRDQNIPFIGMRFWLLLLFSVALIYIGLTIKNYQKNSELTILYHSKAQKTDKYLPQPKKKRKSVKHR